MRFYFFHFQFVLYIKHVAIKENLTYDSFVFTALLEVNRVY